MCKALSPPPYPQNYHENKQKRQTTQRQHQNKESL